jgi:hypothetical protein
LKEFAPSTLTGTCASEVLTSRSSGIPYSIIVRIRQLIRPFLLVYVCFLVHATVRLIIGIEIWEGSTSEVCVPPAV